MCMYIYTFEYIPYKTQKKKTLYILKLFLILRDKSMSTYLILFGPPSGYVARYFLNTLPGFISSSFWTTSIGG